MKIIGIGNAITDAFLKTSDEVLSEKNLSKGAMSLIDKNIAQELASLKFQTIDNGGSVANTIAGVAQLGLQSDFIGKVGNDNFGRSFSENLQKNNIGFIHGGNAQDHSAVSFIFVTPDGQRTMCTYLGCASQIDENDIDEYAIKSAQILYLEGYLWYAADAMKAIDKAIKIAKENNIKIALNLSDFNCVNAHKTQFLDLIKNDVDILIANEKEISNLLNLDDSSHFDIFLETKNQQNEEISQDSWHVVKNNFQNLEDFFPENLLMVITRSQKGCVLLQNKKTIIVETKEILDPIDTTGAGDAFAAGFFYGYLNGFSLEKSAQIGNLLASKIIQKFGARFTNEEIKEVKSLGEESVFSNTVILSLENVEVACRLQNFLNEESHEFYFEFFFSCRIRSFSKKL